MSGMMTDMASTTDANVMTDSTTVNEMTDSTIVSLTADITTAGPAAPTASTAIFTDASTAGNALSSTMQTFTTTTPDNLAIIIGCSVGGAVLLILLIILITYCVLKVKRKRAFEGKYSPSANEQKGGVPMNDIMAVIQPPPPERLI